MRSHPRRPPAAQAVQDQAPAEVAARPRAAPRGLCLSARTSIAWSTARWRISDDWAMVTLRVPASAEEPRRLHDRLRRRRSAQSARNSHHGRAGTAEKWEDFSAQTPGRRARTFLRFAHTGEVWGFVGQTIAGLVSAGGAVLVYTGVARRRLGLAPAPLGLDEATGGFARNVEELRRAQPSHVVAGQRKPRREIRQPALDVQYGWSRTAAALRGRQVVTTSTGSSMRPVRTHPIDGRGPTQLAGVGPSDNSTRPRE